jgi:hypothetical protein
VQVETAWLEHCAYVLLVPAVIVVAETVVKELVDLVVEVESPGVVDSVEGTLSNLDHIWHRSWPDLH